MKFRNFIFDEIHGLWEMCFGIATLMKGGCWDFLFLRFRSFSESVFRFRNKKTRFRAVFRLFTSLWFRFFIVDRF